MHSESGHISIYLIVLVYVYIHLCYTLLGIPVGIYNSLAEYANLYIYNGSLDFNPFSLNCKCREHNYLLFFLAAAVSHGHFSPKLVCLCCMHRANGPSSLATASGFCCYREYVCVLVLVIRLEAPFNKIVHPFLKKACSSIVLAGSAYSYIHCSISEAY